MIGFKYSIDLVCLVCLWTECWILHKWHYSSTLYACCFSWACVERFHEELGDWQPLTFIVFRANSWIHDDTLHEEVWQPVVIFLLVWDFYWRLFDLFLEPFLGTKKSPFLTQPNQWENYKQPASSEFYVNPPNNEVIELTNFLGVLNFAVVTCWTASWEAWQHASARSGEIGLSCLDIEESLHGSVQATYWRWVDGGQVKKFSAGKITENLIF